MSVYILLACLILPPLVLLMKRKQNKHLPPGPPKLPIIGNLHQLGALSHRSLWKLSKKYGPVIQMHLGGVPTVIVSSSEAAKQVLKYHDIDSCSRPLLTTTGKLSYNYIDIAFVPYGNYWREMRKISVLELFSTKRVQSFRYIREQEVALLIDSISQSSLSSVTVDMSEKLVSLTASMACKSAFGKKFEGNEFDEGKFHEILLEKSFHDLDGFYQQVIDQHLKTKETKQEEEEDIIDLLLKLERNQTEVDGVRFSQNHIKAILMNLFLAGVDPGATTMIWAMTEPVRNPRVMKKAQEEIRTCVGKKGKVNEGELEQLKYLKMVVKETMRLHPPGPLLLPRETMSHFKINGYDIYPKTRVHVNIWAIGREPDVWKSPEEYIPERFEDGLIDFKGQNYELLPFGAGRRGCPGIYMGVTMVELALANLMLCFDWKLPSGMKEEDVDMEEVAGLAVYKKLPLKLVPVSYIYH
ncbi:Cytochrome P450 [Quillaja saponaria]|uniref:Cytochrome P450 n=1 Tax=Quillaja saponaria TaxID=32244 RepID=A0AAD7P895_QUISA|nr:Cytochrome P450 [Quillaja saponaria]